MKIAFITANEILGPSNDGGVLVSKRNLELLKQAFGDENIVVCAITKHKEFLSKTTGNIKVFYSCRKKLSILANVFSGRLMFGGKTETDVNEFLKKTEFDLIFFESSRMGYLQKRLKIYSVGRKQVIFLLNVEADYIGSLIKVKPWYFVLYPAFKKNEVLAMKYADKVIALNNRDSERARKLYGRASDLIIPVTIADRYDNSMSAKIKSNISMKRGSNEYCIKLLFVGSLFPPNEHGVRWFVKEVMPYVNAELTIVGKDFEKLKGTLDCKNVKVIGTVDDVTKYYCETDAVVSPIFLGSGMKVKTAEALMYGVPIFATDEALEGYEVDDIENIYRCNSASEFISAINKYEENNEAEQDDSIRELFLKKYCTATYVPILKELLTAINNREE